MSKHFSLGHWQKRVSLCDLLTVASKTLNFGASLAQGMNWSLRVVEQIEMLPKVASSRVCRHGIEETQPERFIDARNSRTPG